MVNSRPAGKLSKGEDLNQRRLAQAMTFFLLRNHVSSDRQSTSSSEQSREHILKKSTSTLHENLLKLDFGHVRKSQNQILHQRL